MSSWATEELGSSGIRVIAFSDGTVIDAGFPPTH